MGSNLKSWNRWKWISFQLGLDCCVYIDNISCTTLSYNMSCDIDARRIDWRFLSNSFEFFPFLHHAVHNLADRSIIFTEPFWITAYEKKTFVASQILPLTSPVTCNVYGPTRSVLVLETKSVFFCFTSYKLIWVIKKMFVNSDVSYWWEE